MLGVAPDADAAAIRARYLTLARRHHPDLFPVGSDERHRAEQTMALVNAAWATLRDPGARSRLDADRRRRGRGRAAGSSFAGGREPGSTRSFVPRDGFDDEPFDERHDVALSAGGLPSWLRLAPPLSLAGGAGLFVLGGFTGILPVVAVGMGAMAVSGVLFVLAPLVALASSRRATPRSPGGPPGGTPT